MGAEIREGRGHLAGPRAGRGEGRGGSDQGRGGLGPGGRARAGARTDIWGSSQKRGRATTWLYVPGLDRPTWALGHGCRLLPAGEAGEESRRQADVSARAAAGPSQGVDRGPWEQSRACVGGGSQACRLSRVSRDETSHREGLSCPSPAESEGSYAWSQKLGGGRSWVMGMKGVGPADTGVSLGGRRVACVWTEHHGAGTLASQTPQRPEQRTRLHSFIRSFTCSLVCSVPKAGCGLRVFRDVPRPTLPPSPRVAGQRRTP